MKKMKGLTAEDVWAMFAETDKRMKETDKQIKALQEELGGIGHSNGAFAEDFFYNSLEKNMNFAGVHFDSINDDFGGEIKLSDGTIIKDQFDIVMRNDKAIAIIEIKYKAESDYPKKMAEKKNKNFRLLFPYYAKYKIYLGLGSLSFNQRVIQEAKKYGIGLLKQRGETIEFKTDWVKVY
jgi:hypothetical protein